MENSSPQLANVAEARYKKVSISSSEKSLFGVEALQSHLEIGHLHSSYSLLDY